MSDQSQKSICTTLISLKCQARHTVQPFLTFRISNFLFFFPTLKMVLSSISKHTHYVSGKVLETLLNLFPQPRAMKHLNSDAKLSAKYNSSFIYVSYLGEFQSAGLTKTNTVFLCFTRIDSVLYLVPDLKKKY